MNRNLKPPLMAYERLIDCLKQHGVFSEDAFEQFARHLSLKWLDKGEIWETSGRISLHMAFINQGIFREYYQKDGQEFTRGFYAEGDFMGNHFSYLEQTPSLTTVVALEKAEILSMSFEQLQQFSQEIPEVGLFNQHIAHQKSLQLHTRNASLLTELPAERYQAFLATYPALANRIPLYLIAQYLGMRPETLSRIRKRIS
ncbi:MAG: Crp/Fnr family transcriptional regulator [Bacteroidota bacterium]